MQAGARVRIGHKAPDFHCDAVVKGIIEDVTLSTYISDKKPSWLILLFIPAAFSFVCPTEVLAFQNCLDEFRDRNCEVVFVSVDTKHSLWHWQNVPRQYGGLGQIDIALLSDATHKMSRDYGVLIEEDGICLRGMFILDDQAVVQQVTLNNTTVGRSVLEALRLLEAFQAVAKHGILCPIDWKPSRNAADTLNTISNTLTASYDERLANLQKEFGDTVITDLDAKRNQEQERKLEEEKRQVEKRKSSAVSTKSSISSTSSHKHNSTPAPASGAKEKPKAQPAGRKRSPSLSSVKEASPDCLPRKSADTWLSNSAPTSAATTPLPTPGVSQRPQMRNFGSSGGTARHARGHTTSIPLTNRSNTHNTYSTRTGSHVVLEFADPTLSPKTSPHATPQATSGTNSVTPMSTPIPSYPAPALLARSSSITSAYSGTNSTLMGTARNSPSLQGQGQSQTRLQMTFEAIKKLSSGLASPRLVVEKKVDSVGADVVGSEAEVGVGGYFDVEGSEEEGVQGA